MTGAQRASLMRGTITRRGQTLSLLTAIPTLQSRVPGAAVEWTKPSGEVVPAGTAGAVQRVTAKAIRLTDEQVKSELEDTAQDGLPTQIAGWETTDEAYPLFRGQESFLHRGVEYTVLRILEIEDGDTLIKAVLVTDYGA